jgi:hypothetical protein
MERRVVLIDQLEHPGVDIVACMARSICASAAGAGRWPKSLPQAESAATAAARLAN